jgi:dihydrofolate reductase
MIALENFWEGSMKISMIAAMSENKVIGQKNDNPWRIPGEQKRFRSLTTGKTVIMGRKTYESIGKPLPNRRNIIITRDASYSAPGCEVVTSLKDALGLVKNEDEVFIGGGEAIYRESLPLADRIYLTTIHFKIDGDTFFPDLGDQFKLVDSTDIQGEPSYTYQIFDRQQ